MKTLTVLGLMLLSGALAQAHHSFDAEYDSKKPITVTGYVTKLDWLNPHAYVYIDVKDDAVTVNAEFSINRMDFGIKYAGKSDDLIREGVVLRLDVKATPKQA